MKMIETKYSMKYSNFVQKYFEDLSEKFGGVRAASKECGIDPAIISKVKNGKYTPSIKTMRKWFPDFTWKYDSVDQIVTVTINTEMIICKDLEELRTILDRLGYELIIIHKSN